MWKSTSAWVFPCTFATFLQHAFLWERPLRNVCMFIVTPNLSFLGTFKMCKSVRTSWDETQEFCYLTNLRPIFQVTDFQVVDLHKQNVWKTPVEEWNFTFRYTSISCTFIWNVTLSQVFFTHFANGKLIPTFSITRILANGLNIFRPPKNIGPTSFKTISPGQTWSLFHQ